MNKTRKKYINAEQLSSEEIFAVLDSIDSDDEDEVDDLINDSDTEFVSEESLFSGPSNSNSGHSVLVPQTSIHVTNVENTPDGDRQSSAKKKTGVKKQMSPGS